MVCGSTLQTTGGNISASVGAIVAGNYVQTLGNHYYWSDGNSIFYNGTANFTTNVFGNGNIQAGATLYGGAVFSFSDINAAGSIVASGNLAAAGSVAAGGVYFINGDGGQFYSPYDIHTGNALHTDNGTIGFVGDNFFIFWSGGLFNFTQSTFTDGDINCNGTKLFRIVNPTDPTKYLQHACIEGPEAAVFYRGKSTLVDGVAIVTLPHYWSALVDESSATIQLTSILQNGAAFPVAASEVVNGQFTVQCCTQGASLDQPFHWRVEATRKDVPTLVVEPNIVTVTE